MCQTRQRLLESFTKTWIVETYAVEQFYAKVQRKESRHLQYKDEISQ